MGNYASKKPIVKEESEIDISYKKLSNLPQDLISEHNQFSNLHVLNASNNNLATLVGINRLTFLLDLNLEHNSFKELEEDLFQLVELQRLNLSHNQLQHLPEEIRCLKNLKELKCDNNKITSISSELYHLSNLALLALSNNQLDIYPIELSLLSHLKVLDLHGNRIPQIPASAFAQCNQLTHLNLSHNALRELPARLFDPLPHLVKLYVSHNQLKQLPNMDKLVALREVDVSYNKLQRVPNFKQRLAFADFSHNPATASASGPEKKEKTVFDEPINFSVEPLKGKRLFHVTGHSYTRAIIYSLDPTSRLPDMGCYIIDNTKALLVWETHRCAPATKEVAVSIAQEYAKSMNIREIGYYSNDSPGDFWKQIDMQNPFAQSRSPLAVKKDYYLDYVMQLKLFCFGEDSKNEIHVDLQAGKRPYHHQLDSACCYVMDSGWDVFVWAGIESSVKQRQSALLKADELMDYPRVKFSIIQWELEGEESVLFKSQFLNWGDDEVQVDIPMTPKSKQEQAINSLKKRHDSFVKLPDPGFGTFPEIKGVKSRKKKPAKAKLKVVVTPPTAARERPPTPDKAKLIPELPIKAANRSLLGFAERPSLPKMSRAPSSNPIRDRQTRHLAYEKVSPRNTEKSPRGGIVVGSPEDLKRVQLKPTGVALHGAEEGKSNNDTKARNLSLIVKELVSILPNDKTEKS